VQKNKKRNYKTARKKWDVQELEKQAILFIIENPKLGIKEFCKKININEIYFYRLCSVERIYNEVKKIQEIKTQEKLEQLKKEFAKDGRKEAFEIAKIYDIAVSSLANNLKDIQSGKLTYRTKGEAVRCQIDLMKILIEMKKEGLIPQQVETDDKRIKLDERLTELIEIQKNVQTNNNSNDGNSETATS